MDPESLAGKTSKAPPRKVRFAPKALPKREPKLVLPKAEKHENNSDDAKAEQLLMRRFNEMSSRKPKDEKKAPTQLAFGFGGSSFTHKIKKSRGSSSNGGDEQVQKEYQEPWDYYMNYPSTLPIRRPYSGNPELLDEEEFGEDPEDSAYDENETNTAEGLDLLDENANNMFFLQFPSTFPVMTPSAKTGVDEKGNKAIPAQGSGTSKIPCNLESMPAGLMGKMLVYKSGAVKLKLGDTLYDVSTGLDCMFAQDVVAIDTGLKRCCNLGELNKRAVVTPDIDSMLGAIDDL